jgi:predicted transcriptional regulator
MENKFRTLQVIYELVKNDIRPTMSIIHPNEIISRQPLPWDQIVADLHELQNEEYISMKQFSTAVISITEKGFQFIIDHHPVKIH